MISLFERGCPAAPHSDLSNRELSCRQASPSKKSDRACIPVVLGGLTLRIMRPETSLQADRQAFLVEYPPSKAQSETGNSFTDPVQLSINQGHSMFAAASPTGYNACPGTSTGRQSFELDDAGRAELTQLSRPRAQRAHI